MASLWCPFKVARRLHFHACLITRIMRSSTCIDELLPRRLPCTLRAPAGPGQARITRRAAESLAARVNPEAAREVCAVTAESQRLHIVRLPAWPTGLAALLIRKMHVSLLAPMSAFLSLRVESCLVEIWLTCAHVSVVLLVESRVTLQ